MLNGLQSSLWLKKLFPGLVLALLYALCALVLRPFDNLPFIDDWTYAWSVEHLLKTGELRLSDRSVHYLFTQILWGALFCVPFGFSFSTLRLSTVVLSWLGALAFYGILRDLGRPRSESLIATFLLLVNPVFFILTFSYMTDIPFVSLANITFFFLLRGLTHERKSQLWLGSLFAVFAFFIRQLAVAIPTAVLSYLLLTFCRKRLPYLLPAVLCFLFLLLISLSIDRIFGFMPIYAQRLQNLQYWFRVSPIGYAAFMVRILLNVGLALSPLTLPLFVLEMRKAVLWKVIISLIVLEAALSVLTGNILLPIEKGAIWALEELGGTLPLLGGAMPLLEKVALHPFFPPWLHYPLGLLSLVSAAVIILRAIELIRERRESLNFLFLLYAVFQTALIFVLWLFHDRYYLVLLPPLIVVLLMKGLPGMKGTMVGLAIFFVISLTGTWDNLQLNRATGEAFTWLRDKGIPIADIDAGFPFNGWNFYVHPENLPPGARADQDVQRVSADVEKPYVIAVSPLPGYYVLREVRWAPSFWIATDRIYILKK